MAHRETCVLRPEAHTPAERVARRVQTARYVAMCERYSNVKPGTHAPWQCGTYRPSRATGAACLTKLQVAVFLRKEEERGESRDVAKTANGRGGAGSA